MRFYSTRLRRVFRISPLLVKIPAAAICVMRGGAGSPSPASFEFSSKHLLFVFRRKCKPCLPIVCLMAFGLLLAALILTLKDVNFGQHRNDSSALGFQNSLTVSVTFGEKIRQLMVNIFQQHADQRTSSAVVAETHHLDPAGPQRVQSKKESKSTPSNASSIGAEVARLGWGRVSKDESIACRHFDLPVWYPGRFWHPLEWNLTVRWDCANNETLRPWVVMKPGGVAVVDQTWGKDVTCTFKEQVHVDDYHVAARAAVKSSSSYKLEYSDTVKVHCENAKTKETWTDVLLGARENPETKAFPKLEPHQASEDEHMPIQNVLIWMFDGISRNSFIRKLPKSWAYMKNEMNGILFKGFNVHGFNSLPNIIPFWTGKLQKDWLPEPGDNVSRTSHMHVEDLNPQLIIKEYAGKGFVTAFYEDDQNDSGYDTFWISSLNLKGFAKPPAHYYSRTFMQSRFKVVKEFDPLCIGNRSSNVHAQDYLKDLWSMHERQRKFFFFNQVSYTHNSLSNIRLIDDELASFLRTWVNSPRVRNNTLIALMSDHGNHLFTAITLRTIEGFLEQKMPLLYLLVPEWMQASYPEKVSALRTNAAERLTTHADLHATLRHLTDFTGQQAAAEKSENGDIGRSFFAPIPKSRTCSDAGVAPSFCACQEPVVIDPRSADVRKFAELALARINNHLNTTLLQIFNSSEPMQMVAVGGASDGDAPEVDVDSRRIAKGSSTPEGIKFVEIQLTDPFKICRPWRLVDVTLAWQLAKGEMLKDQGDFEYYWLGVVAEPGPTNFKFTMRGALGNEFQLVIDSVMREGSYAEKAKCIMNTIPHMAKWCYCNEGIHTELVTSWKK